MNVQRRLEITLSFDGAMAERLKAVASEAGVTVSATCKAFIEATLIEDLQAEQEVKVTDNDTIVQRCLVLYGCGLGARSIGECIDQKPEWVETVLTRYFNERKGLVLDWSKARHAAA